ncbi:MAG TPA: hypothetical protein VGB85_26175 [Nannocystis sp.]
MRRQVRRLSRDVGPTGLAVDAEGNIFLVGLGFHNEQRRSYLARFHPDGTLYWEKPGDVTWSKSSCWRPLPSSE